LLFTLITPTNIFGIILPNFTVENQEVEVAYNFEPSESIKLASLGNVFSKASKKAPQIVIKDSKAVMKVVGSKHNISKAIKISKSSNYRPKFIKEFDEKQIENIKTKFKLDDFPPKNYDVNHPLPPNILTKLKDKQEVRKALQKLGIDKILD